MLNLSYNKEKNSYVIEFKNYINGVGDTTDFQIEVLDFLADNGLVQANEIYEGEDYLFIDDDDLQTYKLSIVNIFDLINDGETELLPQDNLETYIDWSNENDIDFLKWYFGNEDLSVEDLKALV